MAQGWTRVVQVNAWCSLLVIFGCIAWQTADGHRFDFRSSATSVLISVGFWLPSVATLWLLRKSDNAHEIKGAAVTIGTLSALMLCFVFYMLRELMLDEERAAACLAGLFGFFHACMMFGAVKIYLKLKPRDWQLYGIMRGVWLMLPAALFFLFASISFGHSTTSESTAVGSLRSIYNAEIEYSKTHPSQGFAETLPDLGPLPGAGLIDASVASGARNGYRLELIAGPVSASGRIESFVAIARPKHFAREGMRSFLVDETGVFRYTANNRAPTQRDESSP